MPVYVPKKNNGNGGFYLPDIVFTCEPDVMPCEIEVKSQRNELKKIFRYALINPCLIGEVWSKSNKNPEKETKLIDYEQIETLREYITFEQDDFKVCQYIKKTNGKWSEPKSIEGQEGYIEFFGESFYLKEIYENVKF